MDPIHFVIFIVRALLELLLWSIIISAVLSWLVAFNVINVRHPLARGVLGFLDAVTRPVLRPFQRFIPPLGGMDITPVIVVILIQGALIYLIPAA